MARLPSPASRFLGLLVALAAASGTASGSQKVGSAPVPLRLGVVAEEPNEPSRMLEVYGPLIGQLRDRLRPFGIHVRDLVITRDLEELSQRLVDGEVDFVVETVFPTLVLRERSRSLEPALVVFRRGEREYRTVFFTRKDAPIRALTDLRGQVLVLQALRSTSAFAVPKAELERAGLTLVPGDRPGARSDDVRYVLASEEINQAIWVLRERGAAGAFNEGDWARLSERVRSQLRIFHETAPLLRGLLSFRRGLDPEVRDRTEATLLHLEDDDAGRAALARAAGVTRLERMTDEDRRSLGAWTPVLGPGPSP